MLSVCWVCKTIPLQVLSTLPPFPTITTIRLEPGHNRITVLYRDDCSNWITLPIIGSIYSTNRISPLLTPRPPTCRWSGGDEHGLVTSATSRRAWLVGGFPPSGGGCGGVADIFKGVQAFNHKKMRNIEILANRLNRLIVPGNPKGYAFRSSKRG